MSNEVKWEMLASMGWSNNVWYNGEMNDRLKKSNQHKRWNEKRFPSNHCGWKNEHQVIRWRRIHCKKPYFNPFHQDREPLQRQHDHDCFPNSNYQWLPPMITNDYQWLIGWARLFRVPKRGKVNEIWKENK